MQPGGSYFLGAPLKRGRTPLVFQIFFFTKSCLITISEKSITRNDVLFAELGAIFIFARGGLPKPPPLTGRVKGF